MPAGLILPPGASNAVGSAPRTNSRLVATPRLYVPGPSSIDALTVIDPADLAVSVSGSNATLSWSVSQSDNVSTYSVFRRSPATGAPFDPSVDTPIATGVTSPYVDSGLSGGGYEWEVFGEVAVWTPASLPSLKGWWDASDAASITASGGLVSQWSDKSGGGFHATQATGANQPATGTRTINALNVLDFDGTNDHLLLASNPLTGATAGHAFYVMAIDNDPPSGPNNVGAVLGNWGSSVSSGESSHEPYLDGLVYHGWGTTSRVAGFDPTPALTTARQIDIWSAASDWAYNIDGSSAMTASTTVGWGNGGTSTQFGRSNAGGAGPYFIDARIAEIFVCNAKITGTDLTSARAYLKAKWGTA